MLRRGKHFLPGAFFDDAPGIYHGDAIRHPGDYAEIVGDEEKRELEFAAEMIEQVEDLLLHGCVERGWGSSAMSNFGEGARAMAIIARCRRPPES
jgi:hypothetical protein